MAPLNCDVCHEREGLFLLGNQHTGDQISMCSSDFAIFGVKFAVDALPRGELLALVGLGDVAAEVDIVKEGAAKRGNRKTKRAPAVEEPRPEDAEALAAESPAVADGGTTGV